jgi:regulator of replication initiation timing
LEPEFFGRKVKVLALKVKKEIQDKFADSILGEENFLFQWAESASGRLCSVLRRGDKTYIYHLDVDSNLQRWYASMVPGSIIVGNPDQLGAGPLTPLLNETVPKFVSRISQDMSTGLAYVNSIDAHRKDFFENLDELDERAVLNAEQIASIEDKLDDLFRQLNEKSQGDQSLRERVLKLEAEMEEIRAHMHSMPVNTAKRAFLGNLAGVYQSCGSRRKFVSSRWKS